MSNFLKVAGLLMAFAIASLLWTGCYNDPFTIAENTFDHFFLYSDKQVMPVTVSGNTASGKMILIIHGGPGGGALVYKDSYMDEIVERDFAVVYWDQRYAGGSQGNGGPSHISNFRRDIMKLIHLLKSKYGSQQKIYLFGHSWGGFLAPYFLIESNNQDLVEGWIQVGGAHNYLMNDSLTLQMLLFYGQQELNAGRNTNDWSPIVEFCSNNDFRGRSNAIRLNQYAHLAETLMPDVIEPDFDLISNFISLKIPLTAHLTNLLASGIQKIDEPTYTEPISENLYKINIPTLLLWGLYDFVCPPGLMEDILENAGSQQIEFHLFQRSGHSPMANEPELFWSGVVDWIHRN
ncbi:MAG TPA: alpha/beta hydrolase [Saprospiraceae bacterium]|nr:alpha/beta hydrolase [Saprospiraceae bacterium]